MSTKCSIGLQDGYHFYVDVLDYWVWLNTPDFERLKLMPEETWLKIKAEIIENYEKYERKTPPTGGDE